MTLDNSDALILKEETQIIMSELKLIKNGLDDIPLDGISGDDLPYKEIDDLVAKVEKLNKRAIEGDSL